LSAYAGCRVVNAVIQLFAQAFDPITASVVLLLVCASDAKLVQVKAQGRRDEFNNSIATHHPSALCRLFHFE